MEAALPFPPGEGPFRIRGKVYLDYLRHFDDILPGGHSAVLAGLPLEVRTFFQIRLLPSAMYDILPMTVLVPAAARVGNVCPHALVRSTAAHVAENDLGTLFKLILMVASPETVLMRLPKAAGRYYDFGVTETRMIGPRRCLARQTGVPRQVIDWIVDGTLGWIPLVMGRAGAREVEVLPLEPVRDGEQYGVETVTMAFEIGWQE